MLRIGLIVLTASGPVELRGRNGCDRRFWWGYPLRRGKPLRQRMWVGTAADIQAVRTANGFQTLLPGFL